MTTTLPSFSSYGNYSSNNYGAHTQCFSTEDTDYYYSYRTLVAFRRAPVGLVVLQNYWGPTTGKHLNWIDDGHKAARLTTAQFEQVLAAS